MENPQTALVTGATSGIGLELARIFADEKYKLVIVSRSQQDLDRTAAELRNRSGHEVVTIQSDLSQEGSAKRLFDTVKQRNIKLDVLVNNAGFAEHGLFQDVPLERELQMIQLNLVSLTTLTKLFLDKMVENKEGRILNVASTAAFQPGPLMSVYYATKAYVLSLTESLANELKGTGVTITALCPGPTKTGFQSKVKKDLKLFKGGMMDPRDVAMAGFKGLMKGKTVVIPGFKNKILVQSLRIAPRFLVPIIVRRLQEVD